MTSQSVHIYCFVYPRKLFPPTQHFFWETTSHLHWVVLEAAQLQYPSYAWACDPVWANQSGGLEVDA